MRLIGFAVALAVNLTLAPPAVEAQTQSEKVYRIGLLGTHSHSSHAKGVEALRAGLHDLSYVEGKNIPLSTDGPRGSMIGSPTWRPSWCVSRLTSS